MSTHVIPDGDLNHIYSDDCPCEPLLQVDEETGEMIWVHQIMDTTTIFDNFLKF